MCILQVQAQCYDKFFEVIPEEGEKAEFFIEDVVSHVLLNLFDEAIVDDVTIRFIPRFHSELRHCFLTIYAQCSCKSFAVSPHSHSDMKRTMEESLATALKEFFVTVKIDDVLLHHYQQECELAPALSGRC